MQRIKNKFFLKEIFIVFIIIVNLGFNNVIANQNNAINNIKIAETKILESYELLKSGSDLNLNLTIYVNLLNEAIIYLDESRYYLTNYDYDLSLVYSDESIKLLDEINISLNQALLNEENIFSQLKIINMLIRVVILLIIGLIFLLSYNYIKRNYYKKMLKMKPEVHK